MKVFLANLDDLIREKLSRDKPCVWKTKDGQIIPIREMSDKHLNNTIRMLKEKEAKEREKSAWCNPYEEASILGLTMDDIS